MPPLSGLFNWPVLRETATPTGAVTRDTREHSLTGTMEASSLLRGRRSLRTISRSRSPSGRRSSLARNPAFSTALQSRFSETRYEPSRVTLNGSGVAGRDKVNTRPQERGSVRRSRIPSVINAPDRIRTCDLWFRRPARGRQKPCKSAGRIRRERERERNSIVLSSGRRCIRLIRSERCLIARRGVPT
jgi:hypothetical protein